MKKKLFAAAAAAALAAAMLAGCGNKAASGTGSAAEKKEETKAEAKTESAASSEAKVSIVCTNFAEYDFARAIAGDTAEITMLLKPGAESHTYEPSPEDIIRIQDSDMFVYVGGDSDEWVADILDSMDQSQMHVFKLMDQVDTVEEEHVEGMETEEEETKSEQDEKNLGKSQPEEEPELDEHVWASPVNAMQIVEKMSAQIADIDPDHRADYEKNAADYIGKIRKLDEQFQDITANAARKEIIVADRFPFLYFVKEYGLKYYAAFPGCASNTQPSAQTVAFLIDKVKEDQIPMVFHMELSNEQMANSIAEATGAKSELLNAVHNVSAEDFAKGVTYVDLMQHNAEVLKEALN